MLKALKSMRKDDILNGASYKNFIFSKEETNMKRKVIMCVAAALCLCSGMTAYAAPETMPDGTVFDAEYYAQMYPDVVAVFGTDAGAMYQHYVTYGRN